MMKSVRFGDIVRRANTKEDRHNTDKIYYVGGEHIVTGELSVLSKGLIKGSVIGPMFYFGFKSGQILFVTRNPHLRKAAMVNFDGICSEKTLVLESKDNNILLQDYLALIMQSDDFWHYCETHKSGGVNFFINWSTLSNYEIYLPDLDKQKEIAQKVWSAYHLKRGYISLIKATEEMVKSQFIEMIRDKKRNSKLGDWVDTKIKKARKEFTSNDYIEYIDISSIDKELGEVVSTSNFLMQDAPSRAQQCVMYGDILLSTVRPNLRNIAVNQLKIENTVASSGFCVLRPNDGFTQMILATIKSDDFTNDMISIAKGSNYPAIHDYDVLNYPVYTPSKEELRLITDVISQADKSKLILQTNINLMEKFNFNTYDTNS